MNATKDKTPLIREIPLLAHEHVCTPAVCPDDNSYYVSATEHDDYWLMAGPYATHALALADVRKVRDICEEHDARAFWKAWGTCHVDDCHKPGKLNELKLI